MEVADFVTNVNNLKSNHIGMQKLLAVLVIGVISSMFFIPVAVHATFGDQPNTSSKIGDPSYNEVQNNVKALHMVQAMQQNADAFTESNSLKYKQFYSSYISTHPYQDVNSTSKWQAEKKQLAMEQSGYTLLDTKTNYDYTVQDNKHKILAELKSFKMESSRPAFISCEAWHDCTSKAFIPQVSDQMEHETGNSTITSENLSSYNFTKMAKPEFWKNPSGFVNSTLTWIHTMQDLQKYMTNSTK